jgi:membrane-associated protease RseP (regulator of RpoE activity)
MGGSPVMSVVGIVAFTVALTVSVLLHEAGHLVTARRFGMKASKYFMGFGPTLWSFHRGETEYGVKAIPIGGFVKIEGMTSLDEIDAADEPRAFRNRPARHRAVVMAAGSSVQFVLAILLIYGVLLTLGTTRISENKVGEATCVPTAQSCRPGDPSPAAAAGVRAGDRIVSFDGAQITSWRQFTKAVRKHGAGPAALVVERDGARLTLHPDLVEARRNKDTGGAGKDRVGAIGLRIGVETVEYGPVSAVGETFDIIGSGFAGMYHTMTTKIDDLSKIFGDQRDSEGFISVVGAARISGDVVAAEQTSPTDRLRTFLLLVAMINIAVGVFNLLPLLPLDGGHLAVLGFEQARHGVRRALGYRGPVRRVDFGKLLPATYVTVAVILGFSLIVLSADIVNPIRLE